MSLGYIPVIISIILCEFIIQDIAIYIGAGVGVLSSIYMWQRKGPHIPQFILYSTTGMKVSEKDAFFFCYAARLLSIFIFKTSLVFSIVSLREVILQK